MDKTNKKVRKILAGICLIPAFLCFIKKNNFKFKILNPYKLRKNFSFILKNIDGNIHKCNMTYNILIYYPFRVAEELLKETSIKEIGMKAIRILLKRIISDNTQNKNSQSHSLYDINVIDIYNIINESKAKIISFDIFDTLLTRPILNDPKDIFYIISKKVDKQYHINFVEMRWDAETALNNRHATINDIYDYMAQRYNLSDSVKKNLMQEEITCEKQLLQPREAMLNLCCRLVREGKRLIAISDMYLPSNILLDILRTKKFSSISKVYVSCEAKARKDDKGTLFDYVLQQEGITAENLFHIGDNEYSDYSMPLRKNICALHIPSPLEIIRQRGGNIAPSIKKYAHKDPLWGLLIGHSLERIFHNPGEEKQDLNICTTTTRLASLLVGPFALLIALKARRIAIDNGYEEVSFASRDGWIPFIAYNMISKKLNCPKGKYIKAGRRAYFPFLEDNFMHFFEKKFQSLPNCSLERLINMYFGIDSDIILASIEESDRMTLVGQDHEKVYKILLSQKDAIKKAMEQRRERARIYYNKVFSNSTGRILIFDIGYSGSISKAITKAIGRHVDKVYCWQERKNIFIDNKYGTKTFTLIPEEIPNPFHLAFEELLSPCSGGTIDFNYNGNDITEDICFPKKMLNFYEELEKDIKLYFESVLDRFDSYLEYITESDMNNIIKIFKALFVDNPNGNLTIFKDICFPDPVFWGEKTPSLQFKIENELKFDNVYKSTGFDNPKNKLYIKDIFSIQNNHFSAGIHIHIHNPELIQELYRRLMFVPIKFDLFITYTKKEAINELVSFFSPNTIPNLVQCDFIPVPNRGRDVGPWLRETATAQEKYELFCHIHAKESSYLGFGSAWRSYLLDNLIRPEAINAIWNAFMSNDDLGLVFPEPYSSVRSVMIDANLSLWGNNNQQKMLRKILSSIGIEHQYGRTDQFFSMGTMMWYRPIALKKMFSAKICYSDFPAEPAPNDGTLAHAFERIPPLVAQHSGYDVKSLTIFPSYHYPQSFRP